MPQGAGAVTSSNILEPFNIPTVVGGGPPIQKPPAPSLTFPVFTPPAASSYGTTNPEAVPWTPPDLAGAINKGIETGAHLATDAFANRKSLSEIKAQEQAQKQAILAQSQPGAAERTSVEWGPGGVTTRMVSPAELALTRSQMAQREAETERARAETGRTTQLTPAEVAQKEAEAKRTAAEARRISSGNTAERTVGFTGAGDENTNPSSTVTPSSGHIPIDWNKVLGY